MFNKSYQLYGLINTKSLVTQCIRPIYNLRFHALEQLHKKLIHRPKTAFSENFDHLACFLESYRILQIVRGGKVSWLQNSTVIRWKTFAVGPSRATNIQILQLERKVLPSDGVEITNQQQYYSHM